MSKHLISIEDLTIQDINHLLKRANFFLQQKEFSNILVNKLIANIFFEKSTRTISSFQTAALKLGAKILNLNIESSSGEKGESDFDTIRNISAMGADSIIIRHYDNMFPHLCAKDPLIKSKIFNAGDGVNEHPSQALGDLLLMTHLKPNLSDLKIVICGDILNSRVAHSHIKLYNLLGIKNIHLVAPPELQVNYCDLYSNLTYHYSLKEAIIEADIVMSLRIKKEYMNNKIFSGIFDEFKNFYHINYDLLKLAKKDVILFHPGPVNHDIEIEHKLITDLNYSKILDQVTYGVAMRQAILENILLN